MGKNAGRILILFCTALILIGCSDTQQLVRETDERAYRRGKSLLREGRHEEALTAFLSLAESRPDAPESHLEAGLIYLNNMRDPIAAIYHFRKFLEYKPQSEHAARVRDLIMQATREFARSLPGEPFADEVDRLDLLSRTKDLQTENLKLKQDAVTLRERAERAEARLAEALAALENVRDSGRTTVAPIVIGQPQRNAQTQQQAAANPPAARPDSYTVVAGDTLSEISRKVYGSPGRWMDIYQANRDQLSSPNALKVGQVLRIP